MGDDFLSEDNVAGRTLLRLVSRGSAINAELLRLSDHIPPVFTAARPSKKSNTTRPTYHEVIFDFRYLKNSELYETKLESSQTLIDLDADFREAHIDILQRFYLLFEGIYKYVTDLLKYLEDLDDGVFIQQTLESVLLNEDGRQLLAEAVYLYGVMLLVLDLKIQGVVRERMVISYLRYKGQTDLPLIDEVSALIRRTEYVPGKKVPGYPENYFKRIKLPEEMIEMLIGRLRTDDIYNQMQCYPLPEHRSTALANQSSILYVILYFAPHLLQEEQAAMREIVDKHFSDNWVLPFYLGYTVDLSVEWDNTYPAARIALNNTINPDNVKNYHGKYCKKIPKLLKELSKYLMEGVLVDEFVLQKHPHLMNCFRHCNVTIRWLMLHSTTQPRKLQEIVRQGFNPEDVLLLLLNTAQLEYLTKKIFEGLLNDKDNRWEACKKEGTERMKELGEYFSGDKPLTRVTKNENLQKWFEDIAERVEDLDYNDSTAAGRKIQLLMQALEEVEQFHQIESSLQVKQFLADTRDFLGRMLRVVNIKEEYLIMMGFVSDLSYAFEIIEQYIPLMQERIKRDPSSTIKLRSTFIKLASIINGPLVRINQAESPDLYSVSEYYSGQLVSFVRRVLEIIPISMFFTLKDIISLQTDIIKEIPSKLERAELKDYAQLDHRYELAKKTHSISMFTEGILAMETTLVGIIKVEPKHLLEEGIRKQLVHRLAKAMNDTLIFKTPKIEEYTANLQKLSVTLDGFKRSFQYIQDYVNIYGLKIWQEEFSRIVNFNVEQECNSFLKAAFEHQSAYQSLTIPIPVFPPTDQESVNFIGRLARQLLLHTSCTSTIFIDQRSAWYDKNGRELIGLRAWDLLIQSVGVFGVIGLDKLFCFMIVKKLQNFVDSLRKVLNKGLLKFLSEFTAQLTPTTVIPTNTAKLYGSGINNTAKIWPLFMKSITVIGQMQLLRRQLASCLNLLSKMDSGVLYYSLSALNDSLLSDIHQHYKNPEGHPYPDEDNPLLSELTKYLETMGLHEPIHKIYITTSPIQSFPVLMFLFIISQMPKFYYNNTLRNIMSKKKDKHAVDGAPFVVGVVTLLKQFHSAYTQKFLAYLGQYVRSLVSVSVGSDTKGKMTDLPEEVTNVLLFLQEFCKYGKISRKAVEGYFPAYIFDQFRDE
eukprot:CAMPEP_0174262476 /NCGR_PEP_ID=MMETSP0439-20130205/12995_1 /TAXON_ID=0 /ORGANISM="Stereomyxa ramosa, Strain Chinc5" /LENGTH=1153 /DNA_ID=CAMNT_0015347191 /DNA_START=64 /DNA_END=3525 /DNA_ORIENTATION=-